jgi:CRP-like cAMP-binding protein
MAKPVPLSALPASAKWSEDTKTYARALTRIGNRLQRIDAEREELLRDRTEIYRAMDATEGVTHTDIAALAGSTKGAVDQVLAKVRRQQGGLNAVRHRTVS